MITAPGPHSMLPADKNVTAVMRLASMLMDQVFMGIIAGLFWLPLMLGSVVSDMARAFNTEPGQKSTNFFNGPLFYIALFGSALYICKDSFNGRSLAKRILGVQVVSNKTGLPASPLQCLLRNIFCILWPVEFVVALASPARRLGDMVAGTRLADYRAGEGQPKTRIAQVLLSVLISYGFILLCVLPFKSKYSFAFEGVTYVKTSYNPEASRALEQLLDDKLGSLMKAEVRVYNTSSKPGIKYILIVCHLKRYMSNDEWDHSPDVLKAEVKEYLYSLYPKNTFTGEARLVYSGDGTMSASIFPIGR